MFKLPLVRKQEISVENVKLIGYDKVNRNKNHEKVVHFFLDDYRFESIYNNPENKIEQLKRFKAVLTPDFSMFVEMPIALQLYNCFRNRWVGAYLQEQGISVIPSIRWGSLESFNFCFDGIERGSIVAVSTLGVKKEKSHFLLGYHEMLSRIKPNKVICYGNAFDEMKGDIIEIDYGETNNLSKGFFVKKTCGFVEKGGGSANGQSTGNPKHEFNEKTDMPKFPGYENKSPGKDFEWRGKSDMENNNGNWYNKKTGESFHWDIKHAAGKPPHWDYCRRDTNNRYRIFPDNSWEIKIFEQGENAIWKMNLIG